MKKTPPCEQFVKRFGLCIDVKPIRRRRAPWDKDGPIYDVWKVTITRVDRSESELVLKHYDTGGSKEVPSTKCIIYGLAFDLAVPDTYEQFVLDRGYIGRDSEDIWKSLMKAVSHIKAFLTEEEQAVLLEIEKSAAIGE